MFGKYVIIQYIASAIVNIVVLPFTDNLNNYFEIIQSI